MFFDADVTHTTCSRDKLPIAAVIGSVDSASQSLVDGRQLREQYPAQGRISLGIIKDLYLMASSLLSGDLCLKDISG